MAECRTHSRASELDQSGFVIIQFIINVLARFVFAADISLSIQSILTRLNIFACVL
jgi:hypothetical protein